jgi:polyphosphate kinase
MSNLSTNWGFILRDPDTTELVPVRVKIPTMLPQWIPLTADIGPGERRFLRLEELIRHSADRLFPGMEIVDASLFRILRNAEVELDEEDNESLREAITEALRQRRFEPVVRVDFAPGPSPAVRQALVDRFELTDRNGHKLAEPEKQRVVNAIRGGVSTRRRLIRRRFTGRSAR